MESDELWSEIGSGRSRSTFARRLVRTAAWLTRAKFTAGSVAIVRHNGDVLLVQERYHDRSRWGLPGGFWRWRECPPDAIKRELREEVGLPESYADDLAFIALYPQRGALHLDALFHLEIRGPRPDLHANSHEIRSISWFPEAELPTLAHDAELAFSVFSGVDDGDVVDLSDPSTEHGDVRDIDSARDLKGD